MEAVQLQVAARRLRRILHQMARNHDGDHEKSRSLMRNSCSRQPEELLFGGSSETSSELSSINGRQPTVHQWTSTTTERASVFDNSNNTLSEKTQSSSEKTGKPCNSCGIKWIPKMDVVESEYYYAVTVELPGIGIVDIKVVVDNLSLNVSGERSIDQWVLANCTEKSSLVYHRREILHGPFHVVWPLPSDADRDNVAAEFVNGLLRVVVPKSSRKVEDAPTSAQGWQLAKAI